MASVRCHMHLLNNQMDSLNKLRGLIIYQLHLTSDTGHMTFSIWAGRYSRSSTILNNSRRGREAVAVCPTPSSSQ
jgi:hypothetical protein